MTKEKLRIYFKDGNNRTFTGSYKEENKSIDRLINLVTGKFSGTYTTALVYDRQDSLRAKFVHGIQML